MSHKRWYYLDDKNGSLQEGGPVTAQKIIAMVRSGALSSMAVVRRSDESTWAVYQDSKLVTDLGNRILLELQQEEALHRQKKAYIAKRFAARLIDIWWTSFVAVMLLGPFLPPMSWWIFLAMPLSLVLDAMTQWIFNATPGKALLGLEVLTSPPTSTGTHKPAPPTFLQALTRNLMVAIEGFAAFVPFATLVAFGVQARQLLKGQSTTYDQRLGFVVIPRKVSVGMKHAIGLGAMMTSMIAIGVILTLLAASSDRVLDPQEWVHPVSSKTVVLEKRWQITQERDAAGIDLYRFLDAKTGAMVVMGAEVLEPGRMSQYLHRFMQSNQDMAFNQQTPISQLGPFMFRWSGQGAFLPLPGFTMRMTITQQNTLFWRVVSVFPVGNADAQRQTERLTRALWRSVNAPE